MNDACGGDGGGGGGSNKSQQSNPCAKAERAGCPSNTDAASAELNPLAWFDQMIANCLEHATAAKQQGRPIVGILCEFTPRELIMAAGGVPVCLCGGSAGTIPAAETQLPANLCPLIKSTYGYHVSKSNPFLEMADVIVGETTCDGKKKMYELMGETRPMYVLELPQKAEDEDALVHWRAELRKFRGFLENHFSVTITDAKIWEACSVMNRERRLRRELAALMAADRPPMTGGQLLKLKSSISGLEADLQQYERALATLRAREPASTDSSPVRVLLTGVPIVQGAERVVNIIEDHGGLVVAMENCTGLKPLLDDVDTGATDPITALADKYFHLPCSVLTRNDRRLDVLRQIVKAYRPDCVIDLIWQACLTYDVESYRIKRFVEEELGIPYLRIETDYSPSDSARITLRVEALFEMTRSA